MELKEGQKLRVKEFNERPKHWESHGKMDKWMGEIVTLKRYHYDNVIRIYEDCKDFKYNESGWRWEESDFQIVFDTWEDVKNTMEKECIKHEWCAGCYLDNNVVQYCYNTYFKNKNYKKLAENFEKMFGMECYVLEDERMKKEFNLSDLKDEMVVVNRSNEKYVVLGEKLIRENGFDFICNYKEDFKNNCFDHMDIIKVYNPSELYDIGILGLLKTVGEPIWQEKPIVKNVSLEEINALLKEKYPDVEKFNLPIDNNK